MENVNNPYNARHKWERHGKVHTLIWTTWEKSPTIAAGHSTRPSSLISHWIEPLVHICDNTILKLEDEDHAQMLQHFMPNALLEIH